MFKRFEKKFILNPILLGLDILKDFDGFLNKLGYFMWIFEIEGNLENSDETKEKIKSLIEIFEEGTYYGFYKENGKQYITIRVDIVTKPNKNPEKQVDYDKTQKRLDSLSLTFYEKFKELFPTVEIHLMGLDNLKGALEQNLEPKFDIIDTFLD